MLHLIALRDTDLSPVPEKEPILWRTALQAAECYAGEVGVADVVGSDDTRQLAGGQTQCGRRTSLSESPFPFDTIIAVAN